MCRAHAQVRHLLGAMIQNDRAVTIVDMEAGLEHLSRGTARHVDTLLLVFEPYYKSLETARRSMELGRELGVGQIAAVANKLRDATDAAAVHDYAAAHDLPIIADVPFDDELRRADLSGRAPVEISDAPAVRAIETLAQALHL